MCHIHARNPTGPRYDVDMDETERESYSNRILFCRNHHKLVDDAPDEFPPEVLEQWKREHEEQAPDVPELSPKLLNKLIHEIDPSNLLVYIDKINFEYLHQVFNWESREKFPEKEVHGTYPIVFTLEDLKMLHSRLAALYQPLNGVPTYKRDNKWTEDAVIQATLAVAQITQSAIQYYQVERNRRKSEFYDSQ